ncbi:MAG: zinc ribbon domain-containing protein [Candidatus Alkaliphilus sp. MAG34]|nr:hypothetical protein [Clostridiales bacterium]
MERKFCEHCGSAMESDDIFCPSCGKRITDTDANIEENDVLIEPDEPEAPEMSQVYQAPQPPGPSQTYQAPQIPGISQPSQPSSIQQTISANPFKQFSSNIGPDQVSKRTSSRGMIIGGAIAITILIAIIASIILFLK